jgi:hypothetical protein
MKSELTRAEEHRRYAREARVFDQLYPRMEELLERFGRPKYVPGEASGRLRGAW